MTETTPTAKHIDHCKALYESIKIENFIASCRLEGIVIDKNNKSLDEILEKYRHSDTDCDKRHTRHG